MSTIRTTYDDPALAGDAIERDARALLGQVMGLVADRTGPVPRNAPVAPD